MKLHAHLKTGMHIQMLAKPGKACSDLTSRQPAMHGCKTSDHVPTQCALTELKIGLCQITA